MKYFILLTITASFCFSQTWTKLVGPYTGNIKEMAINSHDTKNIFAVGLEDYFTGGVYKTTNSGGTWKKVAGSNPTQIAISYTNPGIVITDKGISTDGGDSWQSYTPPGNRIVDITFAKNSDNILMLAGQDYMNSFVYLSTNLGTTWTKVSTVDSTAYYFRGSFYVDTISTAIFLLVGDFKYVSSSYYSTILFKSTDQGVTWSGTRGKFSNAATTPSHSTITSLFISKTNPLIVYYSSGQSIFTIDRHGIYKSTDGGQNWNPIFENIDSYNLSINPTNEQDIIVSTSDGFLRSLNAGSSWSKIRPRFIDGRHCLRTSSEIYLAGENFGIQKSSDNGTTWNSIGIIPINAYRLIARGNNVLYVFDYINEVVYRSDNSGNSWYPVFLQSFPGSPSGFQISSISSDKIFSAFYDSIGVSTDAGFTWTYSKTPITSTYNLVIDQSNESEIYTYGSNDVARTTNAGSSWSSISIPTTSSITLFKSPLNNVLYLTSSGGSHVYRSTDKGNNWAEATMGLGSSYFYQIAFDKSTNTVYGYDSRSPGNILWKSNDEGLNWSKVSESNYLEKFLIVNPSNSLNLYSFDSFNYLSGSSNSGINWYPLKDINVLGKVNTAEFQNNLMFVGTENGVYKGVPVLTTSIDLREKELPKTFFLSQNYPNPFNPTTTINYQLPVNSFVTLAIFDALGREVAELVNEERPVGSYTVKFDADGLPSGIYFYQIKTNGFTQTKKLLLMK